MDYWIVSFVIAVAIGLCESTAYDPMVAFVCNRGAMHMDPESGWYSDSRTDCLESKENILEYCKRVYPTLDITNIVEAEHSIIKGWCPLGENNCASPETFKIRPYRCLSGAFQSDALVVPRNCLFDHVHDADQCRDYDYWGQVAAQTCSDQHKMKADSFAMLLPCGTDMFTGVEYVCCPQDGKDDSATDALSVPKINVKVSMPEDKDNMPDMVEKYMNLPSNGEYDNEHEVFELAKKQMLGVNHDKVTKLMKEWAEARDNVMRLKEVDPKQAEKTNAEITDRYQKEYFALEAESDSKSLQLDAIHQQHVQANMNYKKRVAMQDLMAELQAKFYDVEYIFELLQKYITIEEKDAQHCIKHFTKIRARDPQASQTLLPATVEHLTLISTRINQSIDLLDTMEDDVVVAKMKLAIRKWLSESYSDMDKTIGQFKTLTAPETNVAKLTVPIPEDLQIEDISDVETGEDNSANMYKVYAQRLSKTDFVKKPSADVVSIEEEDEVEEEYRDIQPEASNLKLSSMDVAQKSVARNNAISGNMSAGASIAVACGVIAAMMVVVFAILIVKKKSRRSSKHANTYLEVSMDSPDLSPEDRHIAAMQNGYENPTYKMLEARKA